MSELSSHLPISPPSLEIIGDLDPNYATHIVNLDAAIQVDPLLIRIALNLYRNSPGVVGSFLDTWKKGRETALREKTHLSESDSGDMLVNSFVKIHDVVGYPPRSADALPAAHEAVRFDPETERRITHDNGDYILATSKLREFITPSVPVKDRAEKVTAARAELFAVRLGVYIDRVIEITKVPTD
jgi:hypothetical protein